MTLAFHPFIEQVLAAGAGPRGASGFASWKPGDVAGLRAILDEGLAQMRALPAPDSVQMTEHSLSTSDQAAITVRWYRKRDAPDGPAILFFHGGARIAGSVDLYDPLVRLMVDWAGVPILSVDYRLAPESTGSAAMHDGFSALTWLREHGAEWGVDPERIAVMGDSAGGGVAAGVAVLARNASIPLARQILIYPMLDDRTITADVELSAASAMFSYEFNRTAWEAVTHGVSELSPEHLLAAPARTAHLEGLAPAYIEVGELDIFRDEDVLYAQRLWRAGVSTELHVHPGQPHAFDVLMLASPDADYHRDARIRALTSF